VAPFLGGDNPVLDDSAMSAMKRLEYDVTFVTPAFLGDAEQDGQWRTPPFKALLRQWWRVVHAAQHDFWGDLQRMRSEEARLFGTAADNGVSTRSTVRIRLDKWQRGELTAWPAPDPPVAHPEVGERGRQVGSHLYLGYGPLDYSKERRATALKRNAAIQANESSVLSLAFPEEYAEPIIDALALANLYGALGSRSRNGWGSCVLRPHEGTEPLSLDSNAFFRPWRDALKVDWPHAIGKDERGPLVWQTESLDDWKKAMRRLAEIKIGLRTLFKPGANRAPSPEERHWLSYPVTNHSVQLWDKERLRLPNSLRVKLRQAKDGKLRGVIFHVPCLPPAAFKPERRVIEDVWRRVHEVLDNPAEKLSRIPA
jgi:CRISPR-associated protein Cmr1